MASYKKSYKQNVKSMKDIDVFEVFDEYTDWQLIYDYIKEAEHYLVYLDHSTWNGSSGYRITSPREIFYRGYDCHIEMVNVSSGGKVLICRESHHDVPMGHSSCIIALTEKEYEMLESATFSKITEFVMKNIRSYI